MTLKLYRIKMQIFFPNLSTEAIEETKPYVHQSKATCLEQEVAQEDGNAAVGPAAMD